MNAIRERLRTRVITAAVVCFLIAACSGGTGSGPDSSPESGPDSSGGSEQAAGPTSAPPAAPSSAPTTAASEAGPPELGPDPSAEAAPGVYQSDDPPLTLTVPPPRDGLRWYGFNDPGFLLLRVSKKPCDGCELGGLIVLAVDGDVRSAAQEWQDLKPSSLSKPKPVKLGGARGVTFDGKVSPKPGVSVVHGGVNPYGSVVVYILDVQGQTVVAYVENPKNTAGVFARIHTVVKTLRFKT